MNDDKILARLFTIERFPIRYLVIPKCGCTFTKNLLWKLQYGEYYGNALRIHDRDQDFKRASDLGLNLLAVSQEDYAFTIIRNPVDRFLSLYNDKVVGDGHKNYVPLRRTLISKYSLKASPVTISDHQYNCEVLIEWLNSNLSQKIDLEPEAHWTPQSYRKNIIKQADLRLVLMNELNQNLSKLLAPLIPKIDDIIKLAERNSSKKEFEKQEVLNKALRQRINNVYSQDRRIYQALKAWSDPRAPKFSELGIKL